MVEVLTGHHAGILVQDCRMIANGSNNRLLEGGMAAHVVDHERDWPHYVQSTDVTYILIKVV